MNNHWYFVEAEDSVGRHLLAGKKLTFMVSPAYVAVPETRNMDSVIRDASNKGHECCYCTRYTMPEWLNKRIDGAVLTAITKTGIVVKNKFDVSISPEARVVVRAVTEK